MQISQYHKALHVLNRFNFTIWFSGCWFFFLFWFKDLKQVEKDLKEFINQCNASRKQKRKAEETPKANNAKY